MQNVSPLLIVKPVFVAHPHSTKDLFMNALRFSRHIKAFVAPCSQFSRRDGVRGLFSCDEHERGALIAKVPLASCIHEHSLTSDVVPDFQRLHQLLFRSSNPQRNGRGDDSLNCGLQLESTASSDDSPGGIVTFAIKPFEATLAFSLALHYYKTQCLAQACGVECAERFLPHLPHKSMLNEWFFSTIPMQRIDVEGLESPFASSLSDHSSQEVHSCAEQIAAGMADFFVDEVATDDLRRYMEAASEEDLRGSFLSAIYAVRSRSFHIPVVGGHLTNDILHRRSPRCSSSQNHRPLRMGGQQRMLAVVTPIISLINHYDNAPPSVAAVVSASERCVVVRAVRKIHKGEEFMFDYRQLSVADQHQREALHPLVSIDEQRLTNEQLAWESRFQMQR